MLQDIGSFATRGEQAEFHKNGTSSASANNSAPPVVKRRQQQNAIRETNLKTQYRCSLINLEETVQDEELDAILGELSVLESQFEEEIAVSKLDTASSTSSSPSGAKSGQPSPVASVTSSNDSGIKSEDLQQPLGKKPPTSLLTNGKRTESPDTDSAFCDNLSVLSSCSTSSRTDKSLTLSTEEQEAKIKAEKIKLAIEKIKEANVKKIFIKVFSSDGSAKSLLVDEKMSVSQVTRILAEKNHVKLDPRWTLVELIPDLYMERVYEDHENLVENCLMWKVDSKNTLWFIERPEKYDVFIRPERYLLGTSSSQQGDTMEDHARQELLEEYFSSSGVGAPEMEGFVWLKADNKKTWKKFFFVLRTSGLYYAPKGKKSSKDLVCLATFDVNQVYYGAGWKKKYKAPTDYCFAIKHPKIQVKTPKYIRYLCVDTEMEMHQWVTGMRVAKNGKQLFTNYRAIEEDITHADIDILTSKRFSNNSLPITNHAASSSQTLKNQGSSPARTPSSENKSLDSALSSGIVSDINTQSSISPRDLHDIIEVTPVNTIERNSGQLRHSSMSKASSGSTSSSSGCLSDANDRCSSSTGSHSKHNGFESDYPMGGTIKKRPSIIANPKLPLTSTTRGIIRDSEDDSSSLGSGDNVRVGGGGTLLRSAVRQSLRRSSIDKRSPVASLSDLTHQPPIHQLHTVQVHQDIFSQQVEEELNCLPEEDLPPPPRSESIDQLADVDELPPPPPEIYLPTSALKKPPPPPPPHNSASVPVPVRSTKRISFDDDVQVIQDGNQVDQVPLFYTRPVYQANPKKLFTEECQVAAPPKTFLQDLQRVMDKKWQVAEKCRVDVETSPHQVLGFRDNEPSQLVGTGESYSRDESVGAWVLQSHYYNHNEPLYAVCAKNSPRKMAAAPVVLREPTPTNDYPPHHMSRMRHCPQPQRNLIQNNHQMNGKRAPPPPKRSETTQLSTMMTS